MFRTRTWTSLEGDGRARLEILADEVGPSLRWATTTVSKATATDSGQHDQLNDVMQRAITYAGAATVIRVGRQARMDPAVERARLPDPVPPSRQAAGRSGAELVTSVVAQRSDGPISSARISSVLRSAPSPAVQARVRKVPITITGCR